jgi:uncharacterized membrane protein
MLRPCRNLCMSSRKLLTVRYQAKKTEPFWQRNVKKGNLELPQPEKPSLRG